MKPQEVLPLSPGEGLGSQRSQREGGEGLTGEPPALGHRGEALARLNQAQVMHAEGRGQPRVPEGGIDGIVAALDVEQEV